MMAKYVLKLVLIIGFVLWKTSSSILIDYPKYPSYLQRDYRTVILTWNRVEDFNTTGQSDGEWYEIKYKLYLPPDYFPQQMLTNFTYLEPVLILKNLLVGSMVVVCVGLKYNSSKPPDTFSPYLMFETKRVPKYIDIEVPGPVTDIELEEITIQGNKSRVNLAWTAPVDILQSKKKIFRSIQYTVQVCEYNPLTYEEKYCEVIADVVQDHTKARQTTIFEGLYKYNEIWVKRYREVAFLIIPLTLNGRKGSVARKVARLDESSAPPPPYNLTSLDTTKNETTIQWKSNINATSYRLQYNVLGSSEVELRLIEDDVRKITLFGLKQGTDYRIKVAINDCVNGSSRYSSPLIIRTRGSPLKPVISNSEQSINRSNSRILLSVAPLVLLLLKVV